MLTIFYRVPKDLVRLCNILTWKQIILKRKNDDFCFAELSVLRLIYQRNIFDLKDINKI